jgi:uncharacterized membrane protein (DUF2068 family)
VTSHKPHPDARRRALHAIALFEAVKGLAAQAALSGALCIPLETAHLMHSTTRVNAAVPLANVLMVGFLGLQLWRRLRSKPSAAPESPLN